MSVNVNKEKFYEIAGLLTLALGGFGIGLAELCIMGLLPSIAQDFSISESTAGYLVSGYALAVATGAILLPIIFRGSERKRLLLGLILLFIIGNAISSISSNYLVLLIGRIIAALCHGAFFSVGSVVAADLVPKNKRASAISMMFAGLTLSNVIGTPLGTFLGQMAGWRFTFIVITLIGILTFFGIELFIQKLIPINNKNIKHEIIIFKNSQVWLSTLVSIFTFGGLVGPYTYIAFILTKTSKFQNSTIPWLLLLFGAGTFIGNLIGGRVADHKLDRSLVFIISGLVVVLSFFLITAKLKVFVIICLFLWGLVGYATAPGLQIRLMNYANAAPTLGAGINIAALNIGNALGAWVSGLVLSAGFTSLSPIGIGVIFNIVALIILIISINIQRNKNI